MTAFSKPDVIIAGGSVAGISVAAALQKFGYKVLIVEPGLDGRKRMAGELIHPPGIAALAELGLLVPVKQAGATPVRGFAVIPHSSKAVSLGGPPTEDFCVLPYAEVPGLQNQGLALEHFALRESLLRACESLPGVRVFDGGRITAVDRGERKVSVCVSSAKRQEIFSASLLVAADGGSSPTRRLAGIGVKRTRLSTMAGFTPQDAELPHPGYAHVFLNEAGIALAYAVSATKQRVLLDLPQGIDGKSALDYMKPWLKTLPGPLGMALREEARQNRPLVSASYLTVAQTVARGRTVLVGDAAGCCHPLTATGLTTCTRDALRLRDSITEARGDIPQALGAYSNRRRIPEWTRLALATTLYFTFREQSSEVRLLRDGLMRYWKADANSRAASMALLSTYEGRMTVMAQEFAKVMLYGLTAKRLAEERGSLSFLRSRSRSALSLSYRFLQSALKTFNAG